METQVKAAKAVVDVDGSDVFALVLVPQNLLDVEICGRTTQQCIDNVIKGFANRKVTIKKSDDIMSIIKSSVIDKKYCVVVYADTPLLTRETIDQALSFTASYGHKAAQMPRGWVFVTEHIKTCINIESVQIPNLSDEDFIVAYNYNQLALIGTYARARINGAHMQKGVNITDPYNVYIDADVQIGTGTKIGPGVVLQGECKIGRNCDIGAGVVFSTFDGSDKSSITLGDGVFIGANSNLVGPLEIGKNAYVAVGSTITQDIPANSFGMARARQAIRENWKPGQNTGNE